jgi:hypothetical protein
MSRLVGREYRTVTDLGTHGAHDCPHCRNTGARHLYRIRAWITLLGIPVFPYATARYLACPVCGVGQRRAEREAGRRTRSMPQTATALRTSFVG